LKKWKIAIKIIMALIIRIIVGIIIQERIYV